LASDLVDEIIEKSNGVFLWTFLVVRSLIEGLINDDRLMDLHRRLMSFPSDLNQFFAHILTSLDPNYQAQTVRGFQAVLCCRTMLSALNFWYMDAEEEKPGSSLRMGHMALSPEDKERTDKIKVSKMRTRINARFKGLLEVVAQDHFSSFHIYKVDYLHRTVKDFLLTTDAQDLFAKRALPETEIYHLLCNSTLAEIRSMKPMDGSRSENPTGSRLVDDFFFAAREYESRTGLSLNAIIEGLETTIAFQWSWPEQLSDSVSLDVHPWKFWGYRNFTHCAIRWHLTTFVQYKLSTLQNALDKTDIVEQCLSTALQNWHDHTLEPASNESCSRDHLAMLSCLLDLRKSNFQLPAHWIFTQTAWRKNKICDPTTLFSAFKLLCQRGVICREDIIQDIEVERRLFSAEEWAELKGVFSTPSAECTSQPRKRPTHQVDKREQKKIKSQTSSN
jgi:hypothetical protein